MTDLSMDEVKAILREHDVSRRDALKAGALAVAGSAAMSGSAAAQSGDEPLIELAEGSTDPSANGEITRNGADIKAYSGGSVKTLNDALDGSQGADGEVWTSTGSGAQWEAASADGLVPLRSVTASDSSSVDFDAGNIDGTYRGYVLKIYNLVPATDGQKTYIRVSNDGGTSYQSGASDYRHHRTGTFSGGSGFNVGSDSASEIRISAKVGNAAGEMYSGSLEVWNPASVSEFTQISGTFEHETDTGNGVAGVVGGAYLTAETTDAIRVVMASGNITSGVFDLYGVTTP